jgi:hypothetical protein
MSVPKRSIRRVAQLRDDPNHLFVGQFDPVDQVATLWSRHTWPRGWSIIDQDSASQQRCVSFVTIRCHT